jgi:ABC-type nickel/cobalt efflux system permease component RcnA
MLGSTNIKPMTLFAVFLMLAFVLAPFSADAQHVEEASDTHCAYCVDHDAHPDNPDEDPNHHSEHHAHACGTCHFHAPAFDDGPNSYGTSSNVKFRFLSDLYPSSVISDLFRPPRI